ncbi:hypothetical protein [Rothia nasimurium]|uniref:hypothetical protein n=1 Tax=Rothia nasimurium TaxID=85336 RepID=UPI001F3A3EC9|nr:hypothetical protein [Rothia nasimurium]
MTWGNGWWVLGASDPKGRSSRWEVRVPGVGVGLAGSSPYGYLLAWGRAGVGTAEADYRRYVTTTVVGFVQLSRLWFIEGVGNLP